MTTNLKIGVVHKENPAGRAITKLLASLCLSNEHARLFVRSVGREEAAANTASTQYDLAMQQCAAAIPKAKVVIANRGLVWEQKAHMHSPLRIRMENIDILVGEEAQQDVDLKSALSQPSRANHSSDCYSETRNRAPEEWQTTCESTGPCF